MNVTRFSQRVQILNAFGAADITTPEMTRAISDWYSLYYNRERTPDEDPAQRIAYTIISKLTRTAFSEYGSSTRSGDDFAGEFLTVLDGIKKAAVSQALIGGEAWLKPYPVPGGWRVSVIRRDQVFIFGRDGDGKPSDIGTIETVQNGGRYYTLLERRTITKNGLLRIQNRLYSSASSDSLGSPVPLTAIPRYAQLTPDYTFPTPMGLGLAYLKTPLENTVDGTADGVSIYAPAAGLIHAIDHNEALLRTEFDNARSRIFVSDDLLKRHDSGRRTFSDTIFVGLDGDPAETGVTIFSPAIRSQNFEERKQSYLRSIESVIGLKRGLLSEVEAVERTATEVTSSAGDYNLSIMDIQDMWTAAVKEAAQICGILGLLYQVPGAHEIDPEDIVLDFGNGVLYDEEKTWAEYLEMVARGLLKPEIAMGWRFNMPVETPEDLKKIRAKYMPELPGEGDEEL